MAYFRGTFICWRRRQWLSLAAAAVAAAVAVVIVVGIIFFLLFCVSRCFFLEISDVARCYTSGASAAAAAAEVLLLHESANATLSGSHRFLIILLY